MHSPELKKAIRAKTIELEIAIELKKPNKDLLRIYKELKDLRYRLLQAELTSARAEA